MKVLEVRNVHQGLAAGLQLLDNHGVEEESRNGPVLVYPEPVTTVFRHPEENIVFWDRRDTNVAFLIYEAFWMLRGRNDVAPLTRYVKRMADYAERDGSIHGAYGHRWLYHFDTHQLRRVMGRLYKDPTDRRCVVNMWDPAADLRDVSEQQPRDVPCNLSITFQVHGGKLDMTVFNRSNDIIWGTYFANAFHFSILMQHVASQVGVSLGKYRQISSNFHAYVKVFEELDYRNHVYPEDPYSLGRVMSDNSFWSDTDTIWFQRITSQADSEVWKWDKGPAWYQAAFQVLRAHEIYRNTKNALKALDFLQEGNDLPLHHWKICMKEWLTRRYFK